MRGFYLDSPWPLKNGWSLPKRKGSNGPILFLGVTETLGKGEPPSRKLRPLVGLSIDLGNLWPIFGFLSLEGRSARGFAGLIRNWFPFDPPKEPGVKPPIQTCCLVLYCWSFVGLLELECSDRRQEEEEEEKAGSTGISWCRCYSRWLVFLGGTGKSTEPPKPVCGNDSE